MMGGPALAVDDRDLAELREFVRGNDFAQGIRRRAALGHQVEGLRADRWIGDILGRYRAHPRLRPGASAGNANAGGGYRDPEHPGRGAAPGEGESHGRAFGAWPPRRGAGTLRFLARSSGMTAQASISITHSGRARPWTISPVETGKTPFSHLPTTR